MIKDKKGQVSYFILVAIILVILIFTYLFMMGKGDGVSSNDDISFESAPVKALVQQCLEDVALPGVYLLASNGGYIYDYDNVLLTDKIQVAYHLDFDHDVGVDVEFMEAEIERFVVESMDVCLLDLNELEDFTLRFGEGEAEVDIEKEVVQIDLDYPVEMEMDGVVFKFSKFALDLQLRLGHLVDVKDDIIRNFAGKEFIDLNFLAKSDAEVILMPFDKETMVYALYDNESGESPFIFNFAVKSLGNSAPRMDFVPDFVLTKGREFSYQLNASDSDDDVLRFYTDNALIDMSNDGKFSFTPPTVGEYDIEVCVEDRYLASDCRPIKFMIEDE